MSDVQTQKNIGNPKKMKKHVAPQASKTGKLEKLLLRGAKPELCALAQERASCRG